MAVIFQRGSGGPPGPEKKKYPKADELLRLSRLKVCYTAGKYLRLTWTGPVAKFPSVTNNRVSMIPKGGLYKLLCTLRYRHSPQLVLRAISTLAELRAVNVKNPAHVEVLIACTKLWLARKPERFAAFDTEIDKRMFMLVLCDDLLRLHDTHNILKAACDWAQDVGIVKNDRHVDALAVRAADFFPHGYGTHFIFVPHELVHNSLLQTFESMLGSGGEAATDGNWTDFGKGAPVVSRQTALGL